MAAIGKFSINNGGQAVRFASGNLQYRASDGMWRFAVHQYDSIGNYAGNTTASGRDTQSAWIDLFGYGCNGVDNGQNAYQPWATSQINSDYYDDALIDSNSDWGAVYSLQEGGSWRSLSVSEMVYILFGRNYANRWAYCTIDGNLNLAIFPDGYDNAYGFLNVHGYDPSNITAINVPDDYESLTSLGVVFLPITGYRNDVNINSPYQGFYWISDGSVVFNIQSSSTIYCSIDRDNYFHGRAVRLVTTYTPIISCTYYRTNPLTNEHTTISLRDTMSISHTAAEGFYFAGFMDSDGKYVNYATTDPNENVIYKYIFVETERIPLITKEIYDALTPIQTIPSPVTGESPEFIRLENTGKCYQRVTFPEEGEGWDFLCGETYTVVFLPTSERVA